MNNLVALPYIFTLGAAVVCLVGWGRIKLQFFASFIGAVGLLVGSFNALRIVDADIAKIVYCIIGRVFRVIMLFGIMNNTV